jgi:hypothetical protein
MGKFSNAFPWGIQLSKNRRATMRIDYKGEDSEIMKEMTDFSNNITGFHVF